MSNQDKFSGNSKSLLIENSPEEKAKIETECEEIDRISQLCDALIAKILSRLSITDAFITTILSKHWQCFWNCIDNIVYEEEYGRSASSIVYKFISLTDNVLPLLSYSTIKKLSLSFVFRYDDGLSYLPKIDKWLEFVIFFLQDEHIKQIMSNCPQLECLKLHEFCGFNRLHMTSPKCRRLELIHHGHSCRDWYSIEGDIYFFEIVAPYVEHLTISGVFNYMKIKLRDFSSLNHANLDLYCDENIVKDLLVSACCANELILSSWLIKLTISSYISKLSSPLLDNLLRSTPKLENFMIFPNMTYEDKEIDLLEDKKYLSFEENIFKVSLQNFKNAKVMLLCSGTLTSDATKFDQFSKFLLEHAINSEKLVIVPVVLLIP
ncbi:hypothetical protein R3W88_031734 [Solanum pinnatisectum]|uniref:Uncharacterized protein n=1 Tax=Solanum pinnatisectum TaxID=50273 RepID=A0AAV9LM81_9SOLN|nr:hypothetical protein R3W88_031734 [Solanum pinnatisectum]